MAQIIEVSEQGIKGGAHIARGQEVTGAGLVQIHMLRWDGVALDCLFMIHGRAQMGSRSWGDGGNRYGPNIGHSNKVVGEWGSLRGHHHGVLGTLLHSHGLGFQRAGHQFRHCGWMLESGFVEASGIAETNLARQQLVPRYWLSQSIFYIRILLPQDWVAVARHSAWKWNCHFGTGAAFSSQCSPGCP